MKSAFTKILILFLALSLVFPASLAVFPAKKAEAQQGKAGACIIGLITATGATVPQWLNDILGVPAGQKSGTGDVLTRAGEHGNAFNECILQPLAKIMIIALIRNIGSSIVNWVNSGFDGNPTFVTDFGGTLLDSADQAAGTFIEGSELGFLCNDFGFRIRMALALKYSQPFRQRATCTVTQIGNNVTTNGGMGWDNWLSVTTEPQNNEYGAYIIADDELSERMAKAADIKEKKISLGQGFLDLETCDEYETPDQVNKRLTGSYVVTPNGGHSKDVGKVTTQVTALNADNFQKGGSTQTQTTTSDSTKPQCVRKTTKTPGTVIAGKLNSTFAQGDIQAAVAKEIDDVIAATMNQLAQKVITGAQGLLGMSKKSSGQSYYNRYQNQFYEAGATTDTGATSPAENYQVKDFNQASQLVQGDAQVQNIYKTTDVTSNQALAEQQAQQEAINSTYQSGAEQNFALLKSASESSFGGGSANNAVNGVRETNQYNQAAVTGEEQNPWWEVDLGGEKAIKEVRIWRVTNKPAAETLGTITVIASDGNNENVWKSQAITPTDAGPVPLVVPVGQTRRFVRIEKQGTLDDRCRVTYQYRGETQYESCYHPLELAEVEAVGNVSVGTTTTATSAGSTAATNSSQPVDDTSTATSTLSWATVAPASAASNTGYELHLLEGKPIVAGNELTIKSTLKKNGSVVPYLSVFSAYDFSFGREGEQISTYGITPSNDSGSFQLTRVTNSNPSHYYLFKQGGHVLRSDAASGTYTFETTVSDIYGTPVKTETANFVVQ